MITLSRRTGVVIYVSAVLLAVCFDEQQQQQEQCCNIST